SGRGGAEAASRTLSAKLESLRLAEDRLAMRVLDTLSAYRAAAENHDIVANLVTNTVELAEAERRRFEAGGTSLFIVNQREQALAEAAVSEVNAVRALWSARASWNALIACTEAP
ncbi:MAG: TolC family protein, partial [Myxococcota bacterium]